MYLTFSVVIPSFYGSGSFPTKSIPVEGLYCSVECLRKGFDVALDDLQKSMESRKVSISISGEHSNWLDIISSKLN